MTLIPARITVDGSGDADEVGILVDGSIRPGTGPEQKLVSRSDGSVLAVVRSAEEIFGPVVTFERISSIDEAVSKANATAYGLTSGIVTRDIAVARCFWQGSHAGTVKVNSPLTGVPFHVPFEGYGRSGAGWAEGGESSLEFFTRTKTVYLRS